MKSLCKYFSDLSIHHVFSLLLINSKEKAKGLQWCIFHESSMEFYTFRKYFKYKRKEMCSCYLAQNLGDLNGYANV
jgi:hypothetical protein